MKSLLYILFLFLFYGAIIPVHAQDIRPSTQKQNLYSDRITDSYGQPIAGIKVRVQGSNRYTYTDVDGYFSIQAKQGDRIILSKNGKKINSYRLDGRLNYEVPDLSESVVVEGQQNKEPKAEAKKKDTGTKSETNLLDSARFYQGKQAYKSIDFIEHFLTEEKNQTPLELAQSYSLLADNYYQLKQFDLAVDNYQKALKYNDNADVSIKLAKAYSENKDFENSDKTYNNLLKQKNTPWQKILIWEGLGDNRQMENKTGAAITNYQKALQIAQKNKIQSKIYNLNAKIASLQNKKGDKQAAETYIQKSIYSVQSAPIQKRIKIQNKLAKVYEEGEEYDKEIKLRKKTLAEIEASENIKNTDTEDNATLSLEKPRINLAIGKAYLKKNEYKKAIPYLEKSVVEAQKNANLEIQKNALQKLSELYKKIGNSQKALQNYQNYARIVDSLYKKKEEEIAAAVRLNNELRKKQNRINSLEKDRELTQSRYQLSQSQHQLTQANLHKQRILIYGLLTGLLLLGFALFYMYKSNRQRRLANNLLALKSLRTQMNPHFIFNALNSVNGFIAQSDERNANKYLTDFSKLMRSVLNNSEKDFIPLSEEIDLLKRYLQLEHTRFSDKFDYQIQVDENIDLDAFQIPPMLLQPYVENAVWHGLRYKKEKGNLSISFKQRDPESVAIVIADNGIGRKKSKALKTQNQKKQTSKAMGNIQKRIQILNEMYTDKVDVSIEDLHEDQTGTQVTIILKKD